MLLQVLDVHEAGVRLGLPTRAVYRLVHEGELATRWVGGRLMVLAEAVEKRRER